MKCLLVSHTADLNGAERSLLDLATGLASRNERVAVVCPNHGPLTTRLQESGISIHILAMPRPRRHVLRIVAFVLLWPLAVLRLSLLIHGLSVSVVYNNTIDGLYAPFACLLARKPCVWHIREVKPKSRLLRHVFALLLRSVPRTTVFNSYATMRAYSTASFANWKVVYNGIESASLTANATRDLKRGMVVGFIGQMVQHKRPDRFIRAVAEAEPLFADLHALVAGDGPLLAGTRALSDSLGLSGRVQFVGRMDTPSQFYSAIDALVLTSDKESFGRVLVEAMAAGIPVIASRVGGVPEVVVDGVCGFLVEPDDIQGYAARIVQLASDTRLRTRLGNAGRERVTAHFTVDRYVDELLLELAAAGHREAT